jgi:hypothetical protein
MRNGNPSENVKKDQNHPTLMYSTGNGKEQCTFPCDFIFKLSWKALYKVVHVLLPANGQNTNVILFSGSPELWFDLQLLQNLT